jgi:DNA polymerase I-like protein with 3'-5' exonuclease and polymerase domains
MTGGVLDGVTLRTISSIDDLAECKRWAGERRETPLCFDTESAGLSPYRDECRLIQIGDMHTGWAAPAKLWGGGVLEILRDYQGDLGAHNSPYDWRVIHEQMGLKLNWAKIHDTLTITHLNDSLGAHGLKPRAAQDIDPRAMIGEQILKEAMAKNHWTWATVPLDYPGYNAYGALDPVLTAHLIHKHGPKILSKFREAYDLERATGRIAASMMDAGMLLDVPYIEKQIDHLEKWQRGAMAWLREQFQITSVNSAAQLERALHSVDIPTLVWTDNGNPSFDKDALKLYANNYPQHRHLISTISYARKTHKIVNDHLRKFLELRDSDDVIHASINTCQARTSRQSVTDPPMQTFDRDVPMIRGSYRPRPGNAFVTVDADQIEARMAAHFSSDPGMIEMFRQADESGIDFFRLMAGRIFQVDPAEIPKSDVRRQLTKNSTYARIYGSGLDRMALTAGVPVEQAEPVYRAFGQLYPGPDRLMQQIIQKCKAEVRAGRRGFVTTPTGRVLYTDRNREYAGLNYKIQGHSAEILKKKVIELDAAGYGSMLRLTIHDEVVLECSAGSAKQTMHDVERILTDRTTYQVPLTWGGKVLTERWQKS